MYFQVEIETYLEDILHTTEPQMPYAKVEVLGEVTVKDPYSAPDNLRIVSVYTVPLRLRISLPEISAVDQKRILGLLNEKYLDDALTMAQAQFDCDGYHEYNLKGRCAYCGKVKDDTALLERIIDGAADLEDGEIGTQRCIELYCERNGIPEEYAAKAFCLAFKRGALEAGIPLSVIEGKTKLTDHFSKEYIDWKCNRVVES